MVLGEETEISRFLLRIPIATADAILLHFFSLLFRSTLVSYTEPVDMLYRYQENSGPQSLLQMTRQHRLDPSSLLSSH